MQNQEHTREYGSNHKNGVRVIVTRIEKGLYSVEMFQRPEWGIRYAKTVGDSVKEAWIAAMAAVRS